MNFTLLVLIINIFIPTILDCMEQKTITQPEISTQLLSLIDPKITNDKKFNNEFTDFERKLNSTDFDFIGYHQIKALQVLYLKTLFALSEYSALQAKNKEDIGNHHVFSGFFNTNDTIVLREAFETTFAHKKNLFPYIMSPKESTSEKTTTCYFSFLNNKGLLPRYYHACLSFYCPHFDASHSEESKRICSDYTNQLLNLKIFKGNHFVSSDELCNMVRFAWINCTLKCQNIAELVYLTAFQSNIDLFLKAVYERFPKPHYVYAPTLKKEFADALGILHQSIHCNFEKLFFIFSNDINIQKALSLKDDVMRAHVLCLPSEIQKQMAASASKKKKKIKKNKKSEMLSTAPNSENNNSTQPQQEPERMHDATVPDGKRK